MAQYFFHLINDVTVEDIEGESFDLPAEARSHAVKVAQELGRHRSSHVGRSVCVMDEQGVVIFRTEIRDED